VSIKLLASKGLEVKEGRSKMDFALFDTRLKYSTVTWFKLPCG